MVSASLPGYLQPLATFLAQWPPYDPSPPTTLSFLNLTCLTRTTFLAAWFALSSVLCQPTHPTYWSPFIDQPTNTSSLVILPYLSSLCHPLYCSPSPFRKPVHILLVTLSAHPLPILLIPFLLIVLPAYPLLAILFSPFLLLYLLAHPPICCCRPHRDRQLYSPFPHCHFLTLVLIMVAQIPQTLWKHMRRMFLLLMLSAYKLNLQICQTWAQRGRRRRRREKQ